MSDDIMTDVPKEIANTLELTELGQQAVDGAVEVIEVVRNNIPILFGVFVVGVAGGTGLGYFLAARKLGKEFDARLEVEVQEAKEFYASYNKVTLTGEPLTPQQVMDQRHGVGAAAEAVREYQGMTERSTVEDDEMDETQIRKIEDARVHSISIDKEVAPGGGEITEVVETRQSRNVFTDPDFDFEEEKKHRTKRKPYIITHDEFYANEEDYEQSSLTYYEMDDTLCDEADKPIENTDTIVGDDHLVRFGAGSKDPKIVFVRNERLETDYEIVKSTGSYLEEVLGMPEEKSTELKHSDQRDRRRAMRRDDE